MMAQFRQAREVLRPETPTGSGISAEANERQFLSEMTALSQKYRLGITGDTSVFIMEWDDDERKYSCDSDGKLIFR